jgi:nitroreductase
MSRDIFDIIRSRRSTRSFSDREVPREQVDRLLDAAIWAPSGSNSQSWLFTAICNRETLLKLNDLVKQGFQTYVPDDDYPGKHNVKQYAQREGFNFYYSAPVLIVASNRPGYENAMADCALALENIFLGAESLGLGSCYINALHWLRDDPAIRDFLFGLGIPKEHTICNAAAVGFVDKPSTAPERKPGTTRVVD